MNRVLKHLGCRYPIIQSPMGWIARSQLASAVSRAGGFGMIETSSGEVDNCKAEILAMKEKTDQPFGVNFPLMLLADDQMIEFVAEQQIRFVTTSAGNPEKYIHRLKDAGIIVYHSVANLKSALKAIDAGVDGLIVEGSEGGGFKNPDEVSTAVLLQAIRQHSDIPMVAAGGITDGAGMAAAFALGAEAIQMGTRFVACQESPVHNNYKQAIIDAADTGTVVINKHSKPIVRVLKTQFTESIPNPNNMPDDTLWKIQQLYFGGEMEASIALAGQSAGLIHGIESAETIISNTIEQFFEKQQQAAERFSQLTF